MKVTIKYNPKGPAVAHDTSTVLLKSDVLSN